MDTAAFRNVIGFRHKNLDRFVNFPADSLRFYAAAISRSGDDLEVNPNSDRLLFEGRDIARFGFNASILANRFFNADQSVSDLGLTVEEVNAVFNTPELQRQIVSAPTRRIGYTDHVTLKITIPDAVLKEQFPYLYDPLRYNE